MKPKTYINWLAGAASALSLLASAATSPAVDADNKVVLHYKTVSLGYGYTPDYADGSADVHEAIIRLSYDVSNVLLGVDVANGWFTEGNMNVLTVRPNLGYIFRATDRIHIIPQVGGEYFRYHDWEYYYADGWNFDATLRLNYALSNRIQLGVYGGYVWNLQADLYGNDVSNQTEDTWTVGGDVKFALTDNLGLVPFVLYQPDWENFKVGAAVSFGF